MESVDASPRHRRWALVVTALLLALVGGIYLAGPVNLLRAAFYLVSNDTEYAPGYSESAFKRLKIGATQAEVLAALGAPLSEHDGRPRIEWLYAEEPNREFERNGALAGTLSYTRFEFDEGGNLESLMGQIVTERGLGSVTIESDMFGAAGSNYLRADEAALEGLKAAGGTFANVRAAYGEPTSVFESKVVRWLVYSRSPSSTNYKQRMVGLDAQGRVTVKHAEIWFD